MKKAITIIGLCEILIFSNADFTQTIKSHPEWSRNATIYEENIRQFTPAGTFAAFAKYLRELKYLGVKITWLSLKKNPCRGQYYLIISLIANTLEFNPRRY